MHEPILSPRLAAAAGMVRKGGEICDVGTDHALLPCRLYLDGERKLTAADINEGPLLSAKQTVMHYIGKEDAVRLVLSDGLENNRRYGRRAYSEDSSRLPFLKP